MRVQGLASWAFGIWVLQTCHSCPEVNVNHPQSSCFQPHESVQSSTQWTLRPEAARKQESSLRLNRMHANKCSPSCWEVHVPDHNPRFEHARLRGFGYSGTRPDKKRHKCKERPHHAVQQSFEPRATSSCLGSQNR